MVLVNKAFWWSDFASVYGIENGPDDTIESRTIQRELNRHLSPMPSLYEEYLNSIRTSASSTAKLDFIVLSSAHDYLSAQTGSDYAAGGGGDDILYGDSGNDILRGGAGNDLIIASNENDSPADRDTASYIDATAGITAYMNAKATYVSDGFGSYDFLVGVENVIGSDHDDRIDGQDGIDNTIIGGLGADRLYGGSGNDVLIGGSGDDRLYGETGADIIVSGHGYDRVYLGDDADIDRVTVDRSILENSGSNRLNIYDFHVGAGGDKLDISSLLQSIDYTGNNPLADGYIKLGVSRGTDIKIQFDPDGTGPEAAQKIITIVNTPLSEFSVADNLVIDGQSILYAAILGQSNAKGLTTGGNDNESGASRLRAGLESATGYDKIVTLQRDSGTPIDIAVGGTTVDGNRNTSYTPDQIWWYPDENKPGEVLLRAIDLMAMQIADLRADGNVTPIIIWGQGEAETRLLGYGPDYQSAVERYIQATYSVFDYIKEHLGSDIQFYIMQTGRYNDEAGRIAGESEREISQIQKGLELIYTAQQNMALERDDIHLGAIYTDLRMLHESDPEKYPTDVWHMDYDDREIIGDRLAGFVAADMGINHVIVNPGPYPVRALADLAVHAANASSPAVITGTDGADRLVAASGDTVFTGGLGKDSITAGIGKDTIVFGGNLLPDLLSNADYIHNFQAGTGGDRIDISGLLSAVNYTGTDPVADGYLKLVSGDALTKLYFDADGAGSSNAIFLAALANVDINEFGAENLIISEENTPIASGIEVNGTELEDLVIGTLGVDTIHGMDGKDMIMGGAGADLLYGDSGSDTFIFDSSVWDENISSSADNLEYADIIQDFTVGAGGDMLNIDILLEKAGFSGNDPVSDGYVAISNDNNGNAVFSFDPDGNGQDTAMVLAILKNVDAGQFVFSDNLDNKGHSEIV